MKKQRKAVSLISGGLDSMLATKAIQEQGIHVEGINFFTGFCVEGHTHSIRKDKREKPVRNNSLWVAEQLGIKLHIIDIVEEYKDVVINPQHGYGANLNPCLDCKIFMVDKAKQWMEENNFDFIITGEVIGQRPKSQRKETMPIISKESGADDRLVRPLCGKNLPATLPEKEGWIVREQLFDFSGRSRKPQMALANKWGIEEYAQPAGGCCFLTDPNYSDKLKDLWANRGEKYYELDDIMLLKTGRHLRPKDNFKMIIAREEGETRYMEGYRKQFMWIKTVSHAGPMTLLDGENLSEADIELAARITGRFSRGRNEEKIIVAVGNKSKEFTEMEIKPMQIEDIQPTWYL